jgi:hypothetical protein
LDDRAACRTAAGERVGRDVTDAVAGGMAVGVDVVAGTSDDRERPLLAFPESVSADPARQPVSGTTSSAATRATRRRVGEKGMSRTVPTRDPARRPCPVNSRHTLSVHRRLRLRPGDSQPDCPTAPPTPS